MALRFDIITIFPEVFDDYLDASILGRARKKGLVKFNVHNLRNWAKDKHKTVDDKPFGGGPGMIMKVEPIYSAVSALTARNPKSKTQSPKKRTLTILFSASGKRFNQRIAEQYEKKYDRIIMICGRYEGVDARVGKYIVDEELSVGPYVLTGGELPAMVVADAVTRLVPGVIKKESLDEESFGFKSALRLAQDARFRSRAEGAGGIGEYPQYTRPEAFYPDMRNKKKVWRVPKVLLSGDHKKIADWRKKYLKKAI